MAKVIYPVELIVWADSCNVGDGGWSTWDPDDICEYFVVTAGFVRHEDDKVLAVVMSMPQNATDTYNGQVLIIPKSCIVSRKVLKK